eukprot:3180156-Rhodomonas_salina.7
MSGTKDGYATTSFTHLSTEKPTRKDLRTLGNPGAVRYLPTPAIRDARGTGIAGMLYAAIGLRACYAMSGTSTETLCAATRLRVAQRRMREQTRGVSLRACYAMSGTDVRHCGIRLCACYATSSTDVAYGFMCCYAMSGTDIANDAISLLACYAMSGTNVAYGATSYYCPMCLGRLRYLPTRDDPHYGQPEQSPRYGDTL